jgi:hypothetical protein
MERTSEPINTVTFTELPERLGQRIRTVDWAKVLKELDSRPGQWGLVGEFDQSVRTHINQGRYKYVSPTLYEAYAEKIKGSRANIYLRRRAENT